MSSERTLELLEAYVSRDQPIGDQRDRFFYPTLTLFLLHSIFQGKTQQNEVTV